MEEYLLLAGFTKTASLVFVYLNLFPLSLLLSFKSSSAQQQQLSLSSESKSSNSGSPLCLVRRNCCSNGAMAVMRRRDMRFCDAECLLQRARDHELLSLASLYTVYSSPTDGVTSQASVCLQVAVASSVISHQSLCLSLQQSLHVFLGHDVTHSPNSVQPYNVIVHD